MCARARACVCVSTKKFLPGKARVLALGGAGLMNPSVGHVEVLVLSNHSRTQTSCREGVAPETSTNRKMLLKPGCVHVDGSRLCEYAHVRTHEHACVQWHWLGHDRDLCVRACVCVCVCACVCVCEFTCD